MDDRPYWKKMLAAAADPRAPGAFLAYMMEVDLSDWNPAQVPTTQMKRELITAGLLSSERFLQEVLSEAHAPETEDDYFSEPCAALYERYTRWCVTNGERYQQSSSRFGVQAKAMGFQKTYPRTAGGRVHHYVHTGAPPVCF